MSYTVGMDPKDKKEILDAIIGSEGRVLAKTAAIVAKAVHESEERTHRYIDKAIGDLARMAQTQFDRIASDIEVTNTKLTNLANRESAQDNLLEKHADDIRLIKTKVGIA